MFKQKLSNEKGFTMIELIMVIVILGILAAVAVPKFVDLRGDAAESTADGFLAAANAACSIRYAQRMIDPAAAVAITDGDSVLAAMDDPPSEWAENAGDQQILEATIGGTLYQITVTAEDTVAPTAKASLSKGW